MLSYRHAFHAGNHGDILKHSTLNLILDSLLKKEKPFTVFDTHGGAGIYRLDDKGLLHTQEAERGVIRLLDYACRENPPESLRGYLEFISPYIRTGLYPGSPEISRSKMREGDKLFVAELHNTEIEILKGNMACPPLDSRGGGHSHENTITPTLRHESGFRMLRACTPPLARRGLVLMDPSYETEADYQEPIATLSKTIQRWETAIIILWYPLLRHRRQRLHTMLGQLAEQFASACGHRGDKKLLTAELLVEPENICGNERVQNTLGHEGTGRARTEGEKKTSRLYGSGILVMNSPYLLEEQLRQTLPYLVQALAPESGSWRIHTRQHP